MICAPRVRTILYCRDPSGFGMLLSPRHPKAGIVRDKISHSRAPIPVLLPPGHSVGSLSVFHGNFHLLGCRPLARMLVEVGNKGSVFHSSRQRKNRIRLSWAGLSFRQSACLECRKPQVPTPIPQKSGAWKVEAGGLEFSVTFIYTVTLRPS